MNKVLRMAGGKLTWGEDKRLYRWGFALDVGFQGHPGEDVWDAASEL